VVKASGVLTALALAGAAQAQEITRFEARGTGFIEYQAPPAGDAPAVDYYVSRTTAPAPLVLLIQGSGCTPGFSGLGTPRRSANIFGFLDTAWTGKYAVMTVNKPYSPATPQPDGTAIVSGMQDSSTPILSAEAMAADLRAAGRDVTVRRLPDVGHTLQPAGASGDALWPEYQRILDWFQP